MRVGRRQSRHARRSWTWSASLLPSFIVISAALTRCVLGNNTFLEPPRGVPEAVNDLFRKPLGLVPQAEAALEPKTVSTTLETQLLSVGSPGIPRPLWLVVAASVPTGLLWYGAGYKLLAEEELFVYEMTKFGTAQGFGGPGTLGPFVFGLGLGPLAAFLGIPGGAAWSFLGVAWIYYTQYLLYKRVNELFEAKGLDAPLHVWWLIFPGFNLLIGLRQVHFLAKYWAIERGEDPQEDPLADFFPFIGAPRYTWREFLRRPSLWFAPLNDVEDLQISFLED